MGYIVITLSINLSIQPSVSGSNLDQIISYSNRETLKVFSSHSSLYITELIQIPFSRDIYPFIPVVNIFWLEANSLHKDQITSDLIMCCGLDSRFNFREYWWIVLLHHQTTLMFMIENIIVQLEGTLDL